MVPKTGGGFNFNPQYPTAGPLGHDSTELTLLHQVTVPPFDLSECGHYTLRRQTILKRTMDPVVDGLVGISAVVMIGCGG